MDESLRLARSDEVCSCTGGAAPQRARPVEVQISTSDHKRGPVRKLMTSIVSELRESGQVVGRPVHVLNVMGFRAEEGPARRKRAPYAVNRPASNGRRRVDDWHPIHDWTLAQVRQRIAAAGTRPHRAYAAGMSRLSCRFCVLASRAGLMCSARLNPELAEQYADVERRTGHWFRKDLSMAEIVDAANETGGQLSFAELGETA